ITLKINNQDFPFTPTVYGGVWKDTDGDGIPDVADPLPADSTNGNDSDGDGIPDKVELLYHLNPNDASDAAIVRVDFITNLQAYQNGLPLNADPLSPTLDTDGDWMTDIYEIVNGLNRLDPMDRIDAPMGDYVFNYEKAW